ncbi:hypothetical protein N9Y14_04130 [Alphaproteobacteria bacterium]|nr:hypothetical protein [Alphaproteobacteria bacterium]MDA8779898.1 hypothetical protein [Alphaproteobacteria bacterium]MDB2406053.1 hypothetical protein [Alphaproteobacteria bacterium]MDB2541317.1 hypothetical protein [Alphaproteobacteria bacterium]MDB2656314.1 hypothetical protein [Alphaproteobacteria bacterium]
MVIISCYLLSFILVNTVIFPTQNSVFPDVTQYAALVFLPHGVRVIATWLYREKAILPLLIAHLLLYRIFYWHGADTVKNMVAVLAGSLCVFITMQLFRVSRIDNDLSNFTISHWRSLVLLGFVSSIFNTAGNMLALGDAMSSELHLEVIATFIIGDTLGTLACLLILMLGFRLRRLASSQ